MNPIGFPSQVSPVSFPELNPSVSKPAEGGESFGEMLGNVAKEADMNQAKADEAVKKFVTGETSDIHTVMLAMEQARLSLIMVTDVRNKMVDAYQELSRMSV